MNKKTIFSICFLAITFFTSAQEETKKPSRWSYGINFGTGNSTLENNQYGVLNGNLIAYRVNFTYKFSDKNDSSFLVTGAEFLDVNSSFFNLTTQSKLKNEYAQIPLKYIFRSNFDGNGKMQYIGGVGGYANILMRSTITNLNQRLNTKSGGINFGYTVISGVQYNFDDENSIYIQGDAMSEISAISKNGFSNRQTEILMVSIGFSSRF